MQLCKFFVVKNLLLIVILLVGLNLSFYGYGQDTTERNEYKTERTEKIEKPHAIFFTPLNVFDVVNPNIQIGYGRFFSEKWAWQIDGGIIINHSIPNYMIDMFTGIKIKECPYTNKGFRVRGSVKYIVLEKKIITLSDLYSGLMRTVFGFYLNLALLVTQFALPVITEIISFIKWGFIYNADNRI